VSDQDVSLLDITNDVGDAVRLIVEKSAGVKV
jgi:hypothetical protein